jgi:hypothetical protein
MQFQRDERYFCVHHHWVGAGALQTAASTLRLTLNIGIGIGAIGLAALGTVAKVGEIGLAVLRRVAV